MIIFPWRSRRDSTSIPRPIHEIKLNYVLSLFQVINSHELSSFLQEGLTTVRPGNCNATLEKLDLEFNHSIYHSMIHRDINPMKIYSTSHWHIEPINTKIYINESLYTSLHKAFFLPSPIYTQLASTWRLATLGFFHSLSSYPLFV